jgi:predicted NBD/HSP70 family sugar kinase
LSVIDALRSRGTATRTELARATGLSRTTVATVVGELQACGLVVEETERDARPVASSRGRKAAILRLDASAGAVLGVDFGHSHVRVAVADLSSTVLAECYQRLEVDTDAARALDAACDLVAEALVAAGVDRSRVVAAGMGIPGPIDRRTNTPSPAILPGWSGLQPGPELARRLDLHVEVDNDANLGAFGELSFGAGRGLSDLVYLKHSTGIGAGIVLDGRIHRGAFGMAGELGHVQVREEGDVCQCGNRGCLETVAAAPALFRALAPAHGPELTLPQLLQLLTDGDFGVRRVVNDAGRAAGRVLADVCNVINPEAIVVGGDLSRAGEPLLSGIREAIGRYALPGVADAVEVKAGVLGERAEVLGALALVIGDTERLRSAGLVALHETGIVSGAR